MKNLLTIVAALFLVTVAAHAQGGFIDDPGAVMIGQSGLTAYVEVDVANAKKGQSIANWITWTRTSQGGIVATLNSESFAPEGPGQIDEIPTLDIYQQLSKAAVAEAIRLQHITASGTTKV